MKKELRIITDLQFGSCGKGLFAGYLAKRVHPDTLITAWAPNAGHTFIDGDGRKFVHTAIPNGIVADSVKNILIGPGSVIDPDKMYHELEALHSLGLMHGKNLYIHEHACVVTEEHRKIERARMFKIGSTMKGVGEATVDKIRRDPNNLPVAYEALHGPLRNYIVDTDAYLVLLLKASSAIIEGAQGFSLSMNYGFYPYTTSRDCTTHQLLSDCGVPHGLFKTHVIGVCRTYPIRVANRFDENGNQIGWSGPGYPDQKELKWKDLGMEPELTTVTKLPRRIFSFSEKQIHMACVVNGVDSIFLNFCNYLAERDPAKLESIIQYLNTLAPVYWHGYGPKETDIVEIRHATNRKARGQNAESDAGDGGDREGARVSGSEMGQH